MVFDIYLRNNSYKSLSKTYKLDDNNLSLITLSYNWYGHKIYLFNSEIVVFSIYNGNWSGLWRTVIN